MIKEEEAGTTGAQVRGDIQSGITGDKRPGFDPALAPLETDSEAGGAGLSPEQSDLARTTQRSELEKGPDPSFNSAMRGAGALVGQGAALALAGSHRRDRHPRAGRVPAARSILAMASDARWRPWVGPRYGPALGRLTPRSQSRHTERQHRPADKQRALGIKRRGSGPNRDFDGPDLIGFCPTTPAGLPRWPWPRRHWPAWSPAQKTTIVGSPSRSDGGSDATAATGHNQNTASMAGPADHRRPMPPLSGRMNQPRSSGRTPKATSQPRVPHEGEKSESIRMRWMPSNQCDTTASDGVPHTEPDEGVRKQEPVRRRLAEFGARPPQQPQPDGSDCIHQRVKQAVGQNLEAEVRVGITFERRKQVMPLQHLMQQDAVEKNRLWQIPRRIRPSDICGKSRFLSKRMKSVGFVMMCTGVRLSPNR